jgi:hypothetical protein
MEEYEKYQRGTPQYVYYRALFEKKVLDLESYSTRIRLSQEYGGFRNISAVLVSSLIAFDNEDELFGMQSISVNSSRVCKNCIHRDLPTITGIEGDCISPNNAAKNYFKFPIKLILPSKMGGKEVGHFCECFENKNK